MERYKIEQTRKGEAEYLKSDIRPIMACVGTREDFLDSPHLKEIRRVRNGIDTSQKIHNVDYYADKGELDANNFKHDGRMTYVISDINNKDKFSEGFKNCTGLVVAGKDKKTGENISFLTHQDPDYFLDGVENKNKLKEDLRERIEALKEKCEEGTLDARVFGGNYFGKDEIEYRENYLNSIKLLSSEVSSVLGFKPVVVVGPKTVQGGQDDVFYDNEHRRLYIVRPVVGDATTNPVSPEDIEEEQKKWFIEE